TPGQSQVPHSGRAHRSQTRPAAWCGTRLRCSCHSTRGTEASCRWRPYLVLFESHDEVRGTPIPSVVPVVGRLVVVKRVLVLAHEALALVELPQVRPEALQV